MVREALTKLLNDLWAAGKIDYATEWPIFRDSFLFVGPDQPGELLSRFLDALYSGTCVRDLFEAFIEVTWWRVSIPCFADVGAHRAIARSSKSGPRMCPRRWRPRSACRGRSLRVRVVRCPPGRGHCPRGLVYFDCCITSVKAISKRSSTTAPRLLRCCRKFTLPTSGTRGGRVCGTSSSLALRTRRLRATRAPRNCGSNG